MLVVLSIILSFESAEKSCILVFILCSFFWDYLFFYHSGEELSTFFALFMESYEDFDCLNGIMFIEYPIYISYLCIVTFIALWEL